MDQYITDFIMNKSFKYETYYRFYFFNEIKSFIDEISFHEIEKEIKEMNSNTFKNFDEKLAIGENDSYIASLIRSDLVEDFVVFVNKNINFSLESFIEASIFETNSLLLKRKPKLIEYAAFFGSIQIFQYLLLNNVELDSILWIYAIHGNNPEIIHLLESNNISPPNNSFEVCLKEAIKCHHNDIGRYILDNLIDQKTNTNTNENSFNDKLFDYSSHYYNYSFFPDDLTSHNSFFYLCRDNNFSIVNILLKTKKKDIEAFIV